MAQEDGIDPKLPWLKAFGLERLGQVPEIDVKVPAADGCREFCRIWSSRLPTSLKTYFSFGDGDLAVTADTPMLIDLSKYPTFDRFFARIKTFSGGNRVRLVARARRAGYVVHRFSWELHIPDIFTVNTSKGERSGGLMAASYRRTVEEMGGAPQRRPSPEVHACAGIWVTYFGVFLPEQGYMQGSVQVDERLVGYVVLRRYGDFAIYSMILGHGDHLQNGIMDLIHQDIVKWIIDAQDPITKGMKYLMYGSMESGTMGLLQWKRYSGFEPHRVRCTFTPLCASF